MAEVLEWPLPLFRQKWHEIEVLGMAVADWSSRLVWLPRAIYHNEPESPNVVTSWRTHLDELPECELKQKALISFEAFFQGKGEGFQKAFREAARFAHGKAMANQEQEQEQEQDPMAKGSPSPVSLLLKFYHDEYLQTLGEKPNINGPKDGAILKRLHRTYGLPMVKDRIHRLIHSNEDFYVKSGKTIGVLSGCWNKLGGPLRPKTVVRCCAGRHNPPCADEAICTQRRLAEMRRGA